MNSYNFNAQHAAMRTQQQFQDQNRRWRTQIQQNQLQQLQQQRAMRSYTQRHAPAQPGGSAQEARPVPYIPGHRRRILFLVLILIAGLIAAVSLLTTRLSTAQVVAGTPTVDLNVRSGPSSGAAILDLVRPGQRLVLACQTDGWDYLVEPHAGAFVFDAYVDRTGPLPTCTS